jgi:hypothetical protein
MEHTHMELATLLRIVSSFFLIAAIQGCSQPPPQVIHSLCPTVNAPIQVRPHANLLLTFGNDAIQAAIHSISQHVTQQGNTSTSNLAGMGTDAAINTAETQGKNVTAQDKTALETYLRNDVVPTVRQNPTCIFQVSASHTPDVGIEDVYLENVGEKEIAKIKITNTGQRRTRFIQVMLWIIIEGTPPLSGQTEMVLGPGQWRNVSNPLAVLPMSDIGSGKKKLTLVVQISYIKEEVGSQPFVYREEWKYDHLSKTFKVSPIK